MAVRDFPLLAEIIRTAMERLGQPEGDTGFGYESGEIVHVANMVYSDLYATVQEYDVDWGLRRSGSLSLAANAGTYDLTTNVSGAIRFVRAVQEVDSSGQKVEEFRVGLWPDDGDEGEYRYRYHPETNLLYLMDPTSAAKTIRIHYGVHAQPLAHGLAQSAAGPPATSTITLADHESYEDDEYNTTSLVIYKGTGAGQTRTVSDYDGATRLATVSSAWTTTPSTDSFYTQRPNLPKDADSLFVDELCARLSAKNPSASTGFFERAAAMGERMLAHSAKTYQRDRLPVRRDVLPTCLPG